MKHILILLIVLMIPVKIHSQSQTVGASGVVVPQDTTQLREVVVKSTRPLTTFTDEGRLTRIKGTELSKLGNALDVLGFIPGVSTTNGGVEVVGKGTPLIYINGRKIRNMNELDQLSSAIIKDITVISNPGASYDATVSSVIKITTERPAGEGFSLSERSRFGVRNYLYGNEYVNLNYRSGGTDIFSTLYYGYHRNKSHSSLAADYTLPSSYISSIDTRTHSSGHSVEAKIGFNHYLSESQSFGVYYQFTHYPDRFNRSSDQYVALNNERPLASSSVERQEDKSFNHLIDAYYLGKWGSWKADLTFTAYWRHHVDDLSSQETTTAYTSAMLATSDKTNSSLFSGKADLSRNFWKGSISVGTEISGTDRHEAFKVWSGNLEDNISSTRETDVAVFAQLSQKFGLLSARAGLRYEYTHARYDSGKEDSGSMVKIYNELLPSAMLTLPVGQSSFQLSFSRSYIKPAYSMLSSAVVYSNSYMYYTGNPYLRPYYFNSLELDYNWRWLSVYLDYKRVAGRFLTEYSPLEVGSEIILESKINSPRPIDMFDAVMVVAPGYIGKIYYPVFTAILSTQSYRAPYLGGFRNINNPTGIFRLRNLFRFSKSFNTVLYLEGQTDGESENIWARGFWEADIYFNKSFGPHWNLQLAFEDIFNTSGKRRYVSYDEIGITTVSRRNNMRKVQLSVTYKFNVSKSRYKGTGAGKSEKDRL